MSAAEEAVVSHNSTKEPPDAVDTILRCLMARVTELSIQAQAAGRRVGSDLGHYGGVCPFNIDSTVPVSDIDR